MFSSTTKSYSNSLLSASTFLKDTTRSANESYLITVDAAIVGAIVIFFETRASKELISTVARSRVKEEVLARLFGLCGFRRNRAYNLLWAFREAVVMSEVS